VIARAAALVLALSAGAMTYGVLWLDKAAWVPGGALAVVPALWAVTALALVALAAPGRRWSWARRLLFVAPALVLNGRYWGFQLRAATAAAPVPATGEYLTDEATRAQAALRLLASAQEQHRLVTGRYATALDQLPPQLMGDLSGIKVVVTAQGDRWWRARAQGGAESCAIAVGFLPQQEQADSLDGVPQCRSGSRRHRHQQVHGTRFVQQQGANPSPPVDSGVWLQHRADVARTGVAPSSVALSGVALSGVAPSGTGPSGTTPVRWDARLNGEIRSSVSIAGGQLFVGAHGNGEVAAFRLADGALQWRVRAPNWLHHEPVVGDGVVAYGFGNNENFGPGGKGFGSPPSGYDVLDRATGRLVHRFLTSSTAMGAPAIVGSLLVAREHAGIVHAWDLRTGTLRWSAALPGRPVGPMTNPLVVDSLVVVTSEPMAWCRLAVGTGRLLGCGTAPDGKWGGHASPALAGRLVLMSYLEPPPPFRQSLWRLVLGMANPKLVGTPNPKVSTVALVAVDRDTDQVVWRRRFTGAAFPVSGHVAGTPTVDDDAAMVPLPTIGEVVSVDVATGAVRWRAPVRPARGSVSVVGGRVFTATTTARMVVLDAATGRVHCSAPLPGAVDRAGLSIAGGTGILTFQDGRISAAPVDQWFRCAVSFSRGAPELAETVYLGGRISTGEPGAPDAQALAVRDGRVVAVGSDSAIRTLVGPATRVVPLRGRRVVPGFSDSHWHLPTQARADLVEAGAPAEIVRRLKAWAATRPPTAWITGRGWTPSDFPGNAPHRRYLDAAFPTQPVLIADRDGHQSLANSAALRAAKVTAATPDPPRGVIERERNGSPTGLLKEAAAGLVSRLVPSPTAADIARRIDEESRAAASHGITLLQEASGREPEGPVFEALLAAARADTLRVRWQLSVPFSPVASSATVAHYRRLRDSLSGPWLRLGFAKGMLDGTVDARTAAMLQAYDGTDDRGRPFWPAATLNPAVARYDSAGLQVALHAIGDHAIRLALDAFAHAQRANGRRDSRHRVEHVEVPDPADVPRFKALGVVASTQAIFATPDVTTLTNYAPLLGPVRAARSNSFRQFDDAGAVQAFGSDYPVFPMAPLEGIRVAVTRETAQGTPRGGWHPAGKISAEAALRHYTRDAAWAGFRDQDLGTLAVGKWADFVVIGGDVVGGRVEMTVVGGRAAYVRARD
jgi:predicted amidohydrolase YtcJ/outer membrane protein assembly factor BamB